MLSRSDTLILLDPVMTLLPGQMGARGPERFTSHTMEFHISLYFIGENTGSPRTPLLTSLPRRAPEGTGILRALFLMELRH